MRELFFGLCLCSILALGLFKNLEEVKKNMIRYNKVFTPNKEASKEYEELYKKVYIKVYPSLEKLYKTLTEIDLRKQK